MVLFSRCSLRDRAAPVVHGGRQDLHAAHRLQSLPDRPADPRGHAAHRLRQCLLPFTSSLVLHLAGSPVILYSAHFSLFHTNIRRGRSAVVTESDLNLKTLGLIPSVPSPVLLPTYSSIYQACRQLSSLRLISTFFNLNPA